MDRKLKELIISVIREFTPEGKNTADTITEILGIAREAAYRRLRGDINFSFEEIAIIASKLGFSIDTIIGAKGDDNAVLELHLLNDNNPFDILRNKLEQSVNLLRQLRATNKRLKTRMAMNTLPTYSIFRHPNLSRFYLYKWFYQTQHSLPIMLLSDFEIPETLKDVQNKYVAEMRKMPHYILFMDPCVYLSIVLDITYFHNLKLINKEELELLREDLLNSVNNFERMATVGQTKFGAKVEIYLSAVNIDTPYAHMETDNGAYTRFSVYSIYSLDSKDTRLGEIQKEWIDSLKKYSTSITQCGEIERCRYFNKQREIIKNM